MNMRLLLLGPVQIAQEGQPVSDLPLGIPLALLGYLIAQRKPLPREHLADLFWQDLPTHRGRANLSWTLNKLATMLPSCLEANRHSVQFRHPESCWIDVDVFQALLAQGDPKSLAEATLLYRGAFLEGLSLDDCADFELWLVAERERWRQRAERALNALIVHHAEARACEEALRFARRLLALAPWREETHRQVMRLLAEQGQRGAALAQYEACCRALEAELGVGPSAETVALYRQTGGHPLFTVELLRGMQERGDLVRDQDNRWIEGRVMDWETLPARVEAVIAERIGRLPKRLRDILTVASVEGETFTAEAIARVKGTDESDTVNWLSGELGRQHHLVNAQGIRQAPHSSVSMYRFRHIMFQKYLYHTLDPVERARLHGAVGYALEALHGADSEAKMGDVVPQLARHFQEGEIPGKAVAYRLQAGQRAMQMSAHQEAIAHFTQGLALLEALPDDATRAHNELALQIALGVSLQVTEGSAAPEVDRVYERAQALSQQIGEISQLFAVLWLRALYYGIRGEPRRAREMSEQVLGLARQTGDPAHVLLGHYMLGSSLTFLGELNFARDHLERVIADYDPERHATLAFRYGQDPGVSCLAIRAQTLGYFPSLGTALLIAGVILHQLVHDVPQTQAMADKLIRLATGRRIPDWLAAGICYRGWILFKQGQTEQGIEQMRKGIEDYRATGAGVNLVQFLAIQAEAYAHTGQVQKGLDTLAQAQAIIDRTGERFCEAELTRLKGALLLMQGAREGEAEQHYRRAIEVARRQQAKSWELRATMSLCRLWQKQGKQAEARQMLAEIYDWFTEGFDTGDLKAAKALLAKLG